jgi:hypothetical protein
VSRRPHGLNLECPSVLWFESWVLPQLPRLSCPVCGTVWKVIPLGGGTYWKEVRSLRDWRQSWDPGPLLFLFLPANLCKVSKFLYHTLPPWCIAPNTMETTDRGLSETMSQNKPFLLISWLSQIFCHTDRKLTNIDLNRHFSKKVASKYMKMCPISLITN